MHRLFHSLLPALLLFALCAGQVQAAAAGQAVASAHSGPGQSGFILPAPAPAATPAPEAGSAAPGASRASSWLYQPQSELIALDQRSLEGAPVFRTPDLDGFASLLMAALLLVLLIIGGILLHLLFRSVKDDRQSHWMRPDQHHPGPPDKDALDHNNSYLQ